MPRIQTSMVCPPPELERVSEVLRIQQIASMARPPRQLWVAAGAAAQAGIQYNT